MTNQTHNLNFILPKSKSNAIKVFGIGGGGSNAVNYMFQQHISGVDFVICNTDAQALDNSPIPNKIQLGASLTSGMGAGANPEIGEQSAKESLGEIQQLLDTQTKMIFITAGMGGGTGTGAAPIVAGLAKEMGILTVGIVTMPFSFEGKPRTQQAQRGVEALRKNVDSLIVVDNNKLREVYGNLGFKAGFSKADEVLSTAARAIAEVITKHYKQNIDLQDAKSVLSNSGTAIMGSAKETGEERAKNAIINALDSPLLNDNKITGAKNVLLLIVSGTREVTLDEIGEINEFIQSEAGYDANIIMGVGEDEGLDDAIAVTIVATGFPTDQQSVITNTGAPKKVIHILEKEQEASYDFESESLGLQSNRIIEAPQVEEEKVVYQLEENEPEKPTEPARNVDDIEVTYDEVQLDLEDTTSFVVSDLNTENEEADQKNTEGEQINLIFDLPVNESSIEEIKPLENDADFDGYFDQEVPDAIQNTEVIDAQEVVASSNQNDDSSEEPSKIVHDLSDFEEEEIQLKTNKDKELSVIDINELVVNDFEILKPEVATTIHIKKKTPSKVEDLEVVDAKEISPMNLTIEELKKQAETRKKHMNRFNHKFKTNNGLNVDDLEKQPAYLRRNIELNKNLSSDEKRSRTTLEQDENDNLKLRSNNSFLHDNVD